jgi:hypothetical protein
MRDHKDRLPSALAHGSAKSSDIERARQDIDSAKVCVANAAQVSATRDRRRRSRAAAGKLAAEVGQTGDLSREPQPAAAGLIADVTPAGGRPAH